MEFPNSAFFTLLFVTILWVQANSSFREQTIKFEKFLLQVITWGCLMLTGLLLK